jgi:hypothetical protein
VIAVGAPRIYLVLAAVGVVAAAGIAAAAIIDHTHPRATPQREWVSDWYCRHHHVRCGDQKPWHEQWHEREPFYNYGFAGSLTVAALFGVATLSRARTRSSV